MPLGLFGDQPPASLQPSHGGDPAVPVSRSCVTGRRDRDPPNAGGARHLLGVGSRSTAGVWDLLVSPVLHGGRGSVGSSPHALQGTRCPPGCSTRDRPASPGLEGLTVWVCVPRVRWGPGEARPPLSSPSCHCADSAVSQDSAGSQVRFSWRAAGSSWRVGLGRAASSAQKTKQFHSDAAGVGAWASPRPRMGRPLPARGGHAAGP